MGNRDTRFPVPKNELYYWDEVTMMLKPVIGSDGLQGVKVADATNNSYFMKVNDDGTISVQLASSDVAQPTDVQAVYTQSFTFLPAKTVTAGAWDTTAPYFYVGDASKFVAKLKLGSSKPVSIDLYWSDDQTNIDIVENIVINETTQWKVVVSEVKGNYVKVAVKNEDTASLVFDVKGYKRTI